MLQFECPHCQATLRVPDTALGKIAPCPRCEKTLRVPDPRNQQDTATAPATPPPTTAPQQETPTEKSPDEAVGELFETLSHPEAHRPDEDPLVRIKSHKRDSQGALFTSAVFILLSIVGLYGLYVYFNPGMRGELKGTRVADDVVPTVRIPKRDINNQQAFTEFRNTYGIDRIRIDSQLLKTSFAATDRGLDIVVRPGPTTQLVRVDVLKNEALREFHSENYAKLDQPRKKKLGEAVDDILIRLNETRQILSSSATLLEIRDRLILPACVEGLGYHLTARIGDRVYPCLWQDKDDHLYFAIPRKATRFEIVEKEQPQGSRFPSPLQFEVQLPAKSQPQPETSTEKTEPEEEAELEEAAPSEETADDKSASKTNEEEIEGKSEEEPQPDKPMEGSMKSDE